MKYASLILSGLALLLSIYLLATRNDGAAAVDTTPATADSTETTPRIVYVYADTVLANYEEFATQQAALEQRQLDAENRLQRQARSLEGEIAAFQQKAQQGLLAPNQMAEEEQRLARTQQSILNERDQVGQQLLQESQILNDSLQAKIKRVLSEIRTEFGYDYILSYGPGTGVIMVNEEYDVTEELLRRLNAATEPEENESEDE